jgi:hypothetical protein
MTPLKGSCLCGSVSFEVDGPIRGVGSCHCSKCRRVSGTGGNAQFIAKTDRFRWVQGQQHVVTFKLPDGWGPTRCRTCGSPVPDTYDNGKRMWVPAGLMSDSLGTSIVQHIFCGSRADWDQESPDAQHHDEYPA